MLSSGYHLKSGTLSTSKALYVQFSSLVSLFSDSLPLELALPFPCLVSSASYMYM